MSAVLSMCELYRYQLHRKVSNEFDGKVVFVGINPSTADAKIDDPTIRRLKCFTHHWGYGEFSIVNVFGLRSKTPTALGNARDPIGAKNDWWIHNEVHDANLVVAMWGDEAKVPPLLRYRFAEVNAMLGESKCFGKTKHGCPAHPLYLSSTTVLEKWT